VKVEEPSADPLDDLVPQSPAQFMLPCRICELNLLKLLANGVS
jgi:hypothetical protein